MQIVIDEIERAIQAECFLSAFMLALTLPDTCGRAAYPKMNSGKRYIKWYDEHITKCFETSRLGELPKFDGNACWKLRCALFHSGEMPEVKFDTFELSVTRPRFGSYSGGSRGYTWVNGDEANKKSRVRIDIAGLSDVLLQVAKEFYQSEKDNLDFTFSNLKIIDFDDEASRLSNLFA